MFLPNNLARKGHYNDVIMSAMASQITSLTHHCLLNRWFRQRSKNTSKFRVTGLCEGNSPVTGEFPAQRVSNTENVSIWWRHHGLTCPGSYPHLHADPISLRFTFRGWKIVLFEEQQIAGVLRHTTEYPTEKYNNIDVKRASRCRKSRAIRLFDQQLRLTISKTPKLHGKDFCIVGHLSGESITDDGTGNARRN